MCGEVTNVEIKYHEPNELTQNKEITKLRAQLPVTKSAGLVVAGTRE
jgi:hypothetical protein